MEINRLQKCSQLVRRRRSCSPDRPANHKSSQKGSIIIYIINLLSILSIIIELFACSVLAGSLTVIKKNVAVYRLTQLLMKTMILAS